MDMQTLVVITILVVAIGYAGFLVVKKTKAFSPKSGCGTDCGCNGASKKLTS